MKNIRYYIAIAVSISIVFFLLLLAIRASENRVKVIHGNTKFYVKDGVINQVDSNTIQFIDSRGKLITIKGSYAIQQNK